MNTDQTKCNGITSEELMEYGFKPAIMGRRKVGCYGKPYHIPYTGNGATQHLTLVPLKHLWCVCIKLDDEIGTGITVTIIGTVEELARIHLAITGIEMVKG